MREEANSLATFAEGAGSEDAVLDSDDLQAIASEGLKYSYPLGAGILSLMPLCGVEVSDEAIERWCARLKLPAARLSKDWAFYKDATEKLTLVRQMLMEQAAAAKRKEAQRLKEEAAKAAAEADEAEAKEAEAAA